MSIQSEIDRINSAVAQQSDLMDQIATTLLTKRSANFTTDDTLTLDDNGVLGVNTTDAVEADNTLPVTSAGVYAAVSNIDTSWNDLTDKPDLSAVATTGSWNDLTDKPFEHESFEIEVINKSGVAVYTLGSTGTVSIQVPLDFVFTVGANYRIVGTAPTGINMETTATAIGNTILGNFSNSYFESCSYGMGTITIKFINAAQVTVCDVRIAEIIETVKTLDEKCIPDTIARVSDLSAVATTGSWNDLEDKPFGTEPFEIEVINKSSVAVTIVENVKGQVGIPVPSDFVFTVGADYRIVVTAPNVIMETTATAIDIYTLDNFSSSDLQLCKCIMGTIAVKFINITMANVCDVRIAEIVNLIDEKHIPDTIARVSDIPNAVLTINGAAPDESGNVNVDISETDLTGYATETYVNNAISNIEFPETDLTGYATETYVNNAISNIEFPETDLTGYATETYVNNAISNIEFPETDMESVVNSVKDVLTSETWTFTLEDGSTVTKKVVLG